MSEIRNIVIVTGQNIVGKTTTSTYLRYWCLLHEIPCESKAITDAESLFEALQTDDDEGGLHHTHDWCEPTKYSGSHTHQDCKPLIPFTVIDNKIPDAMISNFFTKLSQIPRTSTIYFVEWAGGSNTHSTNISASEIDYSYAKVNRLLQEGSLPCSWLEQVHSVIHLKANEDLRVFFNKRNYIPCPDEISNGTVSWPTSEAVLHFYGKDDFSEVERIFHSKNIPIFTLENDGSDSFEIALENLAKQLFKAYLEIEDANELAADSLLQIATLIGKD